MPLTPKKTIAQIVDTGNHYVAQVKRNQPSLFDEIGRCMLEQTPLDMYEAHEKGHGRHTSWYCSVYNAIGNQKCTKWKNLRRFIHIKKITYQTKSDTYHDSDRIYISDLRSTEAAYFHKGIRGHWGIENLLHREKDVLHNEDGNHVKIENGPSNMSMISAFAININRKDDNRSLTDIQVENRANIHKLIRKIRT
ncbi:MAG: ISAs1 family transposase [Cyanothece sp. SIO2G6]|nr:ISAs1 family transposase [Cyanothece sp. SIO2G6]